MVLLCAIAAVLSVAAPAGSVTVRLGYFEAGEHPLHYVLRDEFIRQLENMAPADTQFVFIPNGYRSASWIRDSSRVMAASLARQGGIDILVAIGPWVVEDLLAAGYAGPILGVRQIDPFGAGLIDSGGRPAAPNLTVQDMPGKIEDDIGVLRAIAPVKKLGVLWFDTGPERDSIIARAERLGAQAGFETVTADGYDVNGTYAFFKAFSALPPDIDGLYIGPTWGMTVTEAADFFRMVMGRKVPLMTWEGRYQVTRGAFATNYAYGLVSEAHFQALKALRIARGERPADLPVRFRGGSALALSGPAIRRLELQVPAEALLSGELIDDEPPPATEWYTLADAVGRALRSNPSYLATYDAIEAAVQGARAAGAGYLPQVSVEGQAGVVDHHTTHNTVEPLGRQQARASLVLDQTIFSPALLKARKAAGQQERVAAAAQRQARLDLELAVETACLGYLQALDEQRVERRYRELVERTLAYAAAEFYLRDEREPDLSRWQDERNDAITRVLEAENNVYTGRVLLNLLFNLPPERPVALDTNLVTARQVVGADYEALSPLAVQPDRRQQFESYLVDQARAASPTLAGEAARLEVQRTRVDEATARRWPTLDLRAAFNIADEIDDDRGIIDERTDTWSVFGRMKLPLYLGGAVGKERARLKASLSEMEYRRDARLLEVMANIRRETGRLITNIAALTRHGRSVELALHAMGLIINDYEAGKRDMTALLEAYRHARTAELTAIGTRYEYLRAMARLVHTVGWSPSENLRAFPEEFRERAREGLAPAGQ
ncbi:MAG: TolC family protein [candidate division Zixibacteria bacterium]|nr:TolC family protein [candidate division Zixibacteria bacterium]